MANGQAPHALDEADVRRRRARSLDRLVLGCGTSPTPECVNFDINAGPGVDIVGDLTHTPWVWETGEPIADGHFAHIDASHVLEHVPHDVFKTDEDGYVKRLTDLDGLTVVMNEAWRVLVEGGSFLITVPCFNGGEPERCFGDPTHRRYMCRRSFRHYSRNPDEDINMWKEWTGYDERLAGCFVSDPSSGVKTESNGDLVMLLWKPHA